MGGLKHTQTLGEGNAEDNNSSKKKKIKKRHRHWLELAELSLRASLVFGVSY